MMITASVLAAGVALALLMGGAAAAAVGRGDKKDESADASDQKLHPENDDSDGQSTARRAPNEMSATRTTAENNTSPPAHECGPQPSISSFAISRGGGTRPQPNDQVPGPSSGNPAIERAPPSADMEAAATDGARFSKPMDETIENYILVYPTEEEDPGMQQALDASVDWTSHANAALPTESSPHPAPDQQMLLNAAAEFAVYNIATVNLPVCQPQVNQPSTSPAPTTAAKTKTGSAKKRDKEYYREWRKKKKEDKAEEKAETAERLSALERENAELRRRQLKQAERLSAADRENADLRNEVSVLRQENSWLWDERQRQAPAADRALAHDDDPCLPQDTADGEQVGPAHHISLLQGHDREVPGEGGYREQAADGRADEDPPEEFPFPEEEEPGTTDR